MQRVKHLFLTGEIQCGKSSLIDRVLAIHPDWQLGGFRSVTAETADRENRKGVYLLPAGDPNAARGSSNLIGIRLGEGRRTAFPAVFDKVGLALLSDHQRADLIIMDELGTMENESPLFLRQVLLALDGDKPVFGVLKKKDTPFLNAIKDRHDVRLLEVSFQTFEDCFSRAETFLRLAVGEAAGLR